MKTSVPYSYKFLILVWTTLDFYFGKKLSDNRKVYKEHAGFIILENYIYSVLYPVQIFICVKHLEELKTGYN